jgi:hypothetical protein
MTLYVLTHSHGNVASGFYSQFTSYLRLGKYTFSTKCFCDFAGLLASEDPSITIIPGFPQEKFERRYALYCAQLLSKRNQTERRRYAKKWEGKALIEDEFDLSDDQISIPVEVEQSRQFIRIGEYTIEKEHFEAMVFYVLNGGMCGWNLNLQKPDFIESNIRKIRQSKSGLFLELRRALIT